MDNDGNVAYAGMPLSLLLTLLVCTDIAKSGDCTCFFSVLLPLCCYLFVASA